MWEAKTEPAIISMSLLKSIQSRGLSRTAVVGSASRSASIRLRWRETHWPAAARRLQERRHSVSPETFGGAPTRCCWGRVRGTLWAYGGQTELDDTHRQHCASIRNVDEAQRFYGDKFDLLVVFSLEQHNMVPEAHIW